MVAHVWAQGRQEEGRNSARRVFFEGPRLFSYGSHFLTGYRLPDGAAFLNSGRYSVSTSRHQSDARHAVKGACYSVPACLMNDGGRGYSNRFPLPDFMDSRVFALPQYVTRAGAVVDSPYDAEGNHIATGQAKPRPATAAELKAARADLLTLFLKAEETAPADTIAAAFRYAGAKPEEAAKAASKVAAAHAKRAADLKAEEAAKAKERAESWARRAAELPLSTFADSVAEARAEIVNHNWRGQAERQAENLKGQAKELWKAAKAAKARGWTRIVADLKARESILRKGAAGLQAFSDRSQARANWGLYREAAQGGRRALQAGVFGTLDFWKTARKGAMSLGNACRNGLDGQAYMKARAALVGADLARMAEGLAELARAFQEREEAAAREERAAALAKAAADLKAWRSGEGRLPSRLSDTEGGALLRASKVERDESGAIVGGSLDTSHGASVPLLHALRAFRFLKLCRDNGQAWTANGKSLPVGHFRIDSIDARGNFRAGCHVINWPEVAALAASLGVADLAPADTTESRAHV
jgi:hypothetical protein